MAVATTHNLPVQLTTFVGRKWELAAVRTRLDAARLVTLTGVGGAGKSRLALETATTVLGKFRDGIWLVELASLDEPHLRVHGPLELVATSMVPPLFRLASLLMGRLT